MISNDGSTLRLVDFEPDELIPIADAAKLLSAHLTASALRRERDRGNLRTWIIARKEFTCRSALEAMRDASTSKAEVRERVHAVVDKAPDLSSSLASAKALAERLKRTGDTKSEASKRTKRH